MSEIIRKRSNRGRKRKPDDLDIDAISDEKRRKREHNNLAVRRSRDKGESLSRHAYSTRFQRKNGNRRSKQN